MSTTSEATRRPASSRSSSCSRGARDAVLGLDPQPQRERLAGEELPPLLAVRPDEPRLGDRRLARPPLAQPRGALGGVGLGGEHLPVADDRLVRRPVELDAAVAQQHRPLAQPLDLRRVVRDEDDRAAALLELEDLAEALALERLVADREDLVEQEHVRVEVRGDREAEPHVHPRRVRAHRPVDRVLELGERDDLVEALADLRLAETLDRAVQEDVLAAAEVGVEAGAELEQRADPTADGDLALGRLDDPGDQPQQRRLARAVAPDQADRLARRDRDRDVREREHVLRLGAPAQHEQLLQAARLVRADAEAARDRSTRIWPVLHSH